MKPFWITLGLLFSCRVVCAEEPWSVDARHPVLESRSPVPASSAPARVSLPARALRGLVHVYQRRISAYDGPHCHLYPTCSAYSCQCFERHGALMGLLMTVDRLTQEAEVLVRAPVISAWGYRRGFDPVEAEDFWWAKKPSRRRTPRPPAQGSRWEEPGFHYPLWWNERSAW